MACFAQARSGQSNKYKHVPFFKACSNFWSGLAGSITQNDILTQRIRPSQAKISFEELHPMDSSLRGSTHANAYIQAK